MPKALKAAAAEEAGRILAYFQSKGAERIEIDVLQPAAQLLDLYGEDIRSRAFVTRDAAHNEMMLRPDFTVPVASHHMVNGQGPTRYAYCGPVFRKQEPGSDKASEYLQAGFEYFGEEDPALADVEVFMIFRELLASCDADVATGDLGILLAAVKGLSISNRRQAALLRHIWRPDRFRELITIFSSTPGFSANKQSLMMQAEGDTDLHELVAGAGPEIGARTTDEVIARIRELNVDSKEEPLDVGIVEGFRELLNLSGTMPSIPGQLRRLSDRLRGLDAAAEQMESRIDALNDRGCDPAGLRFEASYGRTTLEYYDGFVFGWLSSKGKEPLASGGRYDLINEVLGSGRKCRAIGGVVRPAALIAARRKSI